MRKIILVLVVLAVFTSGITACKTKDSYLVQVMKMVPEDAIWVQLIDIEALLGDPELEDLSYYTAMMVSEMTIPIYLNVISAYAEVTSDSWWEVPDIGILIGDFNLSDLSDIRDYLVAEDYVEGEYHGIEIWADKDDDAVAFINDMIVCGFQTETIEACIRIYKDEETSMYENEDMKAIAEKLPAAVMNIVFGPDEMYRVEALSGGICYQNEQPDDDILNVFTWYKFDNVASAEAALGDVEDEVTSLFGVAPTNIQQRGQYIETTSKKEITHSRYW